MMKNVQFRASFLILRAFLDTLTCWHCMTLVLTMSDTNHFRPLSLVGNFINRTMGSVYGGGKKSPKTKNISFIMGAQWLNGRVLDSRPKGRGFKPHRCHCNVVLEQDTFILA